MSVTAADIHYVRAKLREAESGMRSIALMPASAIPGYLPWEQARVWPCLVWYPSKQQIVRFDTKEEWEQREQEPAGKA